MGHDGFIICLFCCKNIAYYLAALQKAKAAVATAEANEAIAKQTLEGKLSLYNDKVISDFELRTAQNEYKSARLLYWKHRPD